jgi:Fe-S-cluster-containing hydrogenase component 2
MSKIVRMVAKVDAQKCTGCNLCLRVCPTAAFVARNRLPSEPGRSRMIVELNEAACYNAQRCIELCPDDALEMVELEEPFEIGTDMSQVDPAAIKALCAKAGFSPNLKACVCTGTSMAEMAAAILLGADTPEKLSLATGARTGCSEICMHPFLAILAAAGHADAAKITDKAYQWYGTAGTLFEHVGPDGTFPPELLETYKEYRLDRELADLARLRQVRKGG